jgi:hypothetical protein
MAAAVDLGELHQKTRRLYLTYRISKPKLGLHEQLDDNQIAHDDGVR